MNFNAFQNFGNRISYHFLMFFPKSVPRPLSDRLGGDFGLHFGPQMRPKSHSKRLQKPTWKPTRKKDPKSLQKDPQHKPESHRTGSAFEIAKANTPYAQRKQANLTLHEIVESIPATKKRRAPYPQGEHVHRCSNRYFRNPSSKEHRQRKGFTRREDKNNSPSTRPSGQIVEPKRPRIRWSQHVQKGNPRCREGKNA